MEQAMIITLADALFSALAAWSPELYKCALVG